MKLEQLFVLNESPILRHSVLDSPLQTEIPFDYLNKNYDYETISERGLYIYRNKRTGNFISGFLNHETKQFTIIVAIDVKTPIHDKIYSTTRDLIFVSFVYVSKGFEKKGYTKDVYKTLIKDYDIISDDQHYWGAKKLWLSLAETPDINVFVWNTITGNIIRYDGTNIDPKKIWGRNKKHIVLIASKMNYGTSGDNYGIQNN